jgi:hypothetical protein
VDVEQRQSVGDDVALGPLPHLGQRVQVGADRPAREHCALGPAGGARRVDDQRRALRGQLRLGRRRLTRPLVPARHPVEIDDQAAPSGERLRGLGAGSEREDVRIGIGGHVGQLTRARLGIERHRGNARQQGADHRDAGLDPRFGEHRHARAPGQLAGDGVRGIAQLPVCQPPIGERQRDPVGGR